VVRPQSPEDVTPFEAVPEGTKAKDGQPDMVASTPPIEPISSIEKHLTHGISSQNIRPDLAGKEEQRDRVPSTHYFELSQNRSNADISQLRSIDQADIGY